MTSINDVEEVKLEFKSTPNSGLQTLVMPQSPSKMSLVNQNSLNPLSFLAKTPEKEEETVEIVKRFVRRNGFDRPFHPLQLISWFVFFYDFLVYFLINMISLSNYEILVVVCSIVYIIICIGVLFYAIKATRCDPSDPTIRLQKETEARG